MRMPRSTVFCWALGVTGSVVGGGGGGGPTPSQKWPKSGDAWRWDPARNDNKSSGGWGVPLGVGWGV